MSKIVLVDVDGVLCDFVGGVCESWNDYYSDDLVLTPEHFHDLDMSKSLSPNEFRRLEWLIHREGWCSRLQWYPGAQLFLSNLKAGGFDVYAVTAHSWSQTETWCHERLEWLKPCIPPEKVIFANAKGLVKGDYLVEDSTKNLREWCYGNIFGTPILIGQPWNRTEWERWGNNNLTDALEMIQRTK